MSILSPAAQAIFDSAIALPPDQRSLLVDRLVEELSFGSSDIEEAWTQEIERRVQAIDRGEMKVHPGDEVLRSVRERLSK